MALYKIITAEPTSANTDFLALTASATNTVVSSVLCTDAATPVVQLLIKKSGGTSKLLAKSTLSAGVPKELLNTGFALQAGDKLFAKSTTTNSDFIISYVEDTVVSAGGVSGVTITTDSGSGAKAIDTAGSADFVLVGTTGVGITNSGATITATTVPGEIDHDALSNFVAAEHVDWAASGAGTIHTSNYVEFSNLTGEVTSSGAATVIADNVVDEANLKVSNGPTNGYFLSAQSENAGGLTWAAAGTGSGDITNVIAGTGLAGGASSGDATLTIAPGQTTITNVSNAGLKIGRDQHNLIDFATDNRIIFKASEAEQIALIDGALLPVTNNDIDLGSDSLEFKDAWFDGTLEADAITIGGTAIASVLSPVAGHASIATVGTIGTGVWQGTVVASAYLDTDTAHLSGVQAFTGAKTFTDDATFSEALTATGVTDIKSRKFAVSSSTHFQSQGDVLYMGSGSTTQGELCYLTASGAWAATDADAVATSGGVLLAIALGTDPDVNGMLLRGMFTLDHDTGTIADELYVATDDLGTTSAGDITSIPPAGSGDVVRVIGYCLDSTNGQIWFNPSNDFIVLA